MDHFRGGLPADVDAAFVQKILQIAKRKRETNVHYYGQADDLWARLGVTKGGTFCLPATLIARPARLKKSSSDSAASRDQGQLSSRRTYRGSWIFSDLQQVRIIIGNII